MDRMPNRKFMEKVERFKSACKAIDFKPTIRQASKFRLEKGIVFKSTRGGRNNG